MERRRAASPAATLRSPPPEQLVGERWWAFGFPQDARLGSEAYGVVGGVLAYGWVQLDTDSKYGISDCRCSQVSGWRGPTDTVEQIQQRVEHDLYYIDHWSPLFDFKILVLTAIRGFVHRNAF